MFVVSMEVYRLPHDCLCLVEKRLVIGLLEMLEQDFGEQCESHALAAAVADDDWFCHCQCVRMMWKKWTKGIVKSKILRFVTMI